MSDEFYEDEEDDDEFQKTDDAIGEFTDSNSLDDLTKKDFLSKLDDFLKEKKITQESMENWVESLDGFYNDNPTAESDDETPIIMNRYRKKYI